MEIVRYQLRNSVSAALDRAPVCLLLGPRQAGKTYIARTLSSNPENYFDLENLVDQRRLEEDPQGTLSQLYGLVIIDEAQRQPTLFPLLRYLADRPDNSAKFLLLGSASPHLVRGVSESLAGRAAYVDIGGFSVEDIEPQHHEALWLQGALPPAFLPNEGASFNWRLDYLRSLIERDLRELTSMRMPPAALRRLLLLLAQSQGSAWNHSAAARVLSVDFKTVQRYLELLEGVFLIRLLPPFENNLHKRLRKAHKLYFRDAGLAHALLAVRSRRDLAGHPLYGASWEGFALEQVIRVLDLHENECFTYAVHSGAEMDLVVERAGRRYGFEFKTSTHPGVTQSIRKCLIDLRLKSVFVVCPGERDYSLHDKIHVVALRNLPRIRDCWEEM